MPQADFNWLTRQAKNNKSRALLKKLQRDWKSSREQQKVIKGDYFINLDLGKNKICLKKSNGPCALDIYTEIFKHKGHNKLSKFFGKRDKVIIDGGANEGFYTLRMKQNNPDLKIISIEANPVIFEILKKNIAANKLKNVIPVNKFLASSPGQVMFEMVPEIGAIGAKDISLQKRAWLDKSRIKKIPVESATLQELCQNNGIKKVDILKLDVEGAEVDILENSKNFLKNVKKIVVECHTPSIAEKIKSLLAESGFKLLLEEQSDGGCGDLYFIKNK